MYKKILLILAITILLIMPCYAALNTGLKAPDTFEQSKYWEKNNQMDIYSLKNDENTRIVIEKYDEDVYKDLTTTDTELNYYSNPLGNNMTLGIDTSVHEGYVLEVVEHNGKKYLVSTEILKDASQDKLKDTVKYLEEFNKINNLEPV